MAQDLLNRLKQIHSDITENSKAIPKLTELQEELNQAFDKRIEQLLTKNELVRKIKIPKIHIKLWKYKDKSIKIPINWKYLLSAPFIYGMFPPSILFHISIEIYHQICFRLYGIPLVDSKEYFIYDRQLFDMLNPWEKINCKYCSYVNNLIRYSAEIGGRTERYWCPIKYYRRVDNVHSQYTKFVDIDDSKKMRKKWEELRDFSDLE
ncbi:hypothetical protein K8R20_01665 [bacterium]|nr:hypothetical protein [bacterium]